MRKSVTYTGIAVLGVIVILAILLSATDHPHHPTISRTKMELYAITTAAKTYRAAYGSYPTGSQVQIAAALRGQNSGRIVFIEMRRESIGSDGQLIDPWGMPYAINYVGESNIVGKSSGPDKRFNTDDDIQIEE